MTKKSLLSRASVSNFNLFALFMCLFSSCFLDNNEVRGQPNYPNEPIYVSDFCPNEPPLTPNSTYPANLEALFSLLAANATTTLTGFYNSSAGKKPSDIAYGLFLCRGDLSTDDCGNCVYTATKQATEKCESMEGTFWFDQCMLRHSYRRNYTVLDQRVDFRTRNPENVTNPDRFRRVLRETLDDLVKRASVGGGSGKKFAAGEGDYSEKEKLYGLAQCTPDLTPADCNFCLRDCIAAFPNCCANARGATVVFPSCSIRYEFYPFYNTTAVPSPPYGPPASKRKGGISTPALIAVIVPVGFSCLLFAVFRSYLLLTRNMKRKTKLGSIGEGGNNVVPVF